MANIKSGKDFLLYVGTTGSKTLIGAVKAVNVSESSSIVDITTKDSGNTREIMDGAGIKTLSLSVQGLFSDQAGFTTFRTNKQNQTVTEYVLEFPLMDIGNSSKETYEGKFKITQLDLDSEHGEESLSFSATMESSGAITKTAEAA